MMALEEYTAHHADTVENIMYRWPWRRFEGMFKRHLLRQAREELLRMRDMRLAALDANMNYDSSENTKLKQEKSESLQDAFRTAERMLYSGDVDKPPTDEYEDDPLFAPIKARAQVLRAQVNQPLVEQAGMGRQLIEANS